MSGLLDVANAMRLVEAAIDKMSFVGGQSFTSIVSKMPEAQNVSIGAFEKAVEHFKDVIQVLEAPVTGSTQGVTEVVSAGKSLSQKAASVKLPQATELKHITDNVVTQAGKKGATAQTVFAGMKKVLPILTLWLTPQPIGDPNKNAPWNKSGARPASFLTPPTDEQNAANDIANNAIIAELERTVPVLPTATAAKIVTSFEDAKNLKELDTLYETYNTTYPNDKFIVQQYEKNKKRFPAPKVGGTEHVRGEKDGDSMDEKTRVVLSKQGKYDDLRSNSGKKLSKAEIDWYKKTYKADPTFSPAAIAAVTGNTVTPDIPSRPEDDGSMPPFTGETSTEDIRDGTPIVVTPEAKAQAQADADAYNAAINSVPHNNGTVVTPTIGIDGVDSGERTIVTHTPGVESGFNAALDSDPLSTATGVDLPGFDVTRQDDNTFYVNGERMNKAKLKALWEEKTGDKSKEATTHFNTYIKSLPKFKAGVTFSAGKGVLGKGVDNFYPGLQPTTITEVTGKSGPETPAPVESETPEVVKSGWLLAPERLPMYKSYNFDFSKLTPEGEKEFYKLAGLMKNPKDSKTLRKIQFYLTQTPYFYDDTDVSDSRTKNIISALTARRY